MSVQRMGPEEHSLCTLLERASRDTRIPFPFSWAILLSRQTAERNALFHVYPMAGTVLGVPISGCGAPPPFILCWWGRKQRGANLMSAPPAKFNENIIRRRDGQIDRSNGSSRT